MNRFTPIIRRTAMGLLPFLGILLAATISWAADSDGQWRPTYDLVLRWFNFLLLVFILVKYARKPLINFLKGKQAEIGDMLNRIEQQKEAIDRSLNDARQALQKSAERLEEMRQRIIAQGERKKQQIIGEAELESQRIFDAAKEKIGGDLIMARGKIREEIIDAAIKTALEKLPGQVNREDHQNYIDLFLTGTAGK